MTEQHRYTAIGRTPEVEVVFHDETVAIPLLGAEASKTDFSSHLLARMHEMVHAMKVNQPNTLHYRIYPKLQELQAALGTEEVRSYASHPRELRLFSVKEDPIDQSPIIIGGEEAFRMTPAMFTDFASKSLRTMWHNNMAFAVYQEVELLTKLAATAQPTVAL